MKPVTFVKFYSIVYLHGQKTRRLTGPKKTMPRRRATGSKQGVRAIAAETGLSVATVSRALNDAPNVKPKTRDLVRATAQRIGYIPNPAARALSTQRTRTIAAVVPTLAHSIFAQFLNAIEIELATGGYGLVIATSDGDPEMELKRVEEMLVLGAEGLIISGAVHAPALLTLVGQRRTPTICTSIFDPDAVLPTIGYDNRALARQAVDHLLGLGHRRIAVVHGPVEQNDRTQLRLEGARAACGTDTAFVPVATSLGVIGGVEAMRTLVALDPMPTAVLCLSDVLALGVGFEARSQGLTVPEDVSVMGFDDLDWAAHAVPALTTIGLPVIEMGRRTARALIASLDDGLEITSQRLDAGLIVRASTAPPKG